MARYIFQLLEASLAVLLVVFLLTQVVLPALQGRKLFPFFFRRSERRLREELAERNQQAFEAELVSKAASQHTQGDES